MRADTCVSFLFSSRGTARPCLLASIQPRTSLVKFARSLCTDPPGYRSFRFSWFSKYIWDQGGDKSGCRRNRAWAAGPGWLLEQTLLLHTCKTSVCRFDHSLNRSCQSRLAHVTTFAYKSKLGRGSKAKPFTATRGGCTKPWRVEREVFST